MSRRRPTDPAAALLRAMLPRPVPPARRRTSRSATVTRPRQRNTPTPSGTGQWHRFRFSGPAGSRGYHVYVPPGLGRRTPAPLLLGLHGCTQSALDFAAATRWDQLADRHAFLLVLPEQSPAANPQRCWNWFRTEHQQSTAGEPAILAGIVEAVAGATAWRVDRARVFAVGLSAGAAMALTLGVTHPGTFAALGVHSGPAFGSASGPRDALAGLRGRGPAAPPTGRAIPPLVVVQGTRDTTVTPANAPAVAEQWARFRAADRSLAAVPLTRADTLVRPVTGAGPTARRGHRVDRWAPPGRGAVLEVWTVEGLGHAWSGGAAGGSFSDPRGPRASTEMWRFLSRHRLPDRDTGRGPGTPTSP